MSVLSNAERSSSVFAGFLPSPSRTAAIRPDGVSIKYPIGFFPNKGTGGRPSWNSYTNDTSFQVPRSGCEFRLIVGALARPGSATIVAGADAQPASPAAIIRVASLSLERANWLRSISFPSGLLRKYPLIKNVFAEWKSLSGKHHPVNPPNPGGRSLTGIPLGDHRSVRAASSATADILWPVVTANDTGFAAPGNNLGARITRTDG